MGKERLRGTSIVHRKVIEGFKDDLICDWGERFVGSSLTFKQTSFDKY